MRSTMQGGQLGVARILRRAATVTACPGSPRTGAFPDGWLRTGDIATIDRGGVVTITDHTGDAIKSGGEWPPSVLPDEAIPAHPVVEDVAVIAVDDARRQERPLALEIVEPAKSPA